MLQGLSGRLVGVVLVALAPVLALYTWSALRSQDAQLQQARTALVSQARLAALAQEKLVDRTRHLLEAMASGPSIRDTRIRLCVPYLKNLLERRAEYGNLGVAGLDGKVSCHAHDGGPQIEVQDRDFFNQALTHRGFATGTHAIGRASGRPGVTFGLPVYGADGDINGVAFAAVDARFFGQALAAANIREGVTLGVVDRHGALIAQQPAGAGAVSLNDAGLRQALRDGRTGLLESRQGDEHRVYAIAAVDESQHGGIRVFAGAPTRLILAQAQRTFAIELMVLLLAALAGAGSAWWMARRLVVGPAGALLQVARRVEAGDIGARVAGLSAHHGELARLGGALNQMAESIESRQASLDSARREAERERALLDLVVNSMSEGLVAVDTAGQPLLFNAPARQFSAVHVPRVTLEAWRQWHELLTLEGQALEIQQLPLSRAMRGDSADDLQMVLRCEDAQDRVLSANIRPLRDESGVLLGGLVVFSDITQRRTAERLRSEQDRVLELMAGGAPLGDALAAIVALLEHQLAGAWCSVLMVEAGRLRLVAGSSLPAAFSALIGDIEIAEGAGICGTAAARRQQVIVVDLLEDPLADGDRELAAEFGVQACWSTPILSVDGAVLATFAFYFKTVQRPTPADQNLIAAGTRLARIAIERDRAGRAQRASEALLRELAETIQDVFYVRDARSGSILYVNTSYTTLWGRSADSLYANPLSYIDAIHPQDRQLALAVRDDQAAGLRTDIEYRLLRPDGSVRWIRDTSCPVFGPRGQLERMVGIARDLTERKNADLQMASMNRALQMLSQCNEALAQREQEEALLKEVCRVAVDAGGYRMAWVGYAQDNGSELVQPMAHAGVEAGYLSEIRLSWRADDPTGDGPLGTALRTAETVVCKDISLEASGFFWKEAAQRRGYRGVICLPLHLRERTLGVLVLYLSEVVDVPQEEILLLQELAGNLAVGIASIRARRDRRESEQNLLKVAAKAQQQASLIDQANDAILVRDLDHRIRFWNKGAQRLYGWTADEVLGRSAEEVLYRDPTRFRRAMAQLLERGDWVGELEQVRRDGEPLVIEARWTLVRDDQGRPASVLAINTDISDRRSAQQELLRLNAQLEQRVQQRTAQLAAANHELEVFSYSLAHDLRAPLGAIDGFSHALETGLGPDIAGRSRHHLERIRAGVRRMGDMIDALLSLARLSRAPLQGGWVDLAAIATAELQGLCEREPARRLRWQVQPGLQAWGDQRLLTLVIENLVGNAWKFTSKQALAEITVGQLAGQDGAPVWFVQDNGVGFDMTYGDKLFGVFQRLHASADFPGTGLGLANVQRVVARHGGRVWAESAEGRGATFYFTVAPQP